MDKLMEFVKTGNTKETPERVKHLLEQGIAPEKIMNEALIPAMDVVGDLFQKGDYFLPEMLIAGRAMTKGLEILKPILVETGVESAGRVVVGTVKGDLHDIGKNILIMVLEGAGFEVMDLGIDVPPERFVEAVKEHKPIVLGLSALLSTTMGAMKATVEAVRASGSGGRVKIMVGGAPVTQKFSDEIGADFYGADSTAGRDFAKQCAGKA